VIEIAARIFRAAFFCSNASKKLDIHYMNKLSRRYFMQRLASALAAGSMVIPSQASAGMKRPAKIGVQLFSIPKIAEKDFAGTMQQLAAIGFKEIEFYGPYSFSAAEDQQRWDSVKGQLGFSESGFFGLSARQTKKILDDNGVSAPSMHTGLASLKGAIDQLAEAANELGSQYVVLPSAATHHDLDGYKSQAEEFNAIGREASKRGIRFAYHNHGNGLKPIDGKIPFELILENTDPLHVYFQMDIYWMTAGGVDVVQYLDKYAGRFRLMHVKDMTKEVRFSGDGGDPQQWMELFPYLADAGSGVIDIKNVVSHAMKSGVEHFIVERDLAPNGLDDLKKSYSYLSTL
jgi:sugar phosphate isomerase/epimerase